MNFLRNHKIQKCCASFLLAVLVFINAVKAFHTHDFPNSAQTEKSNKNSTNVSTAFYCAICDFQFAKDSDTEVTRLQVLSPVKIVQRYYDYIPGNVISFSVLSSSRGPPYSYC